jgi:uncharacterized membrane protein
MKRRGFPRVREDDRGAVLPIVALSLVVLMVMTAFSVDIGRQILRRRQAQAVADLVALDLGRLLDGRSTSAIQGDSRWNQTRLDAATRNNFPTGGVSAVLGHWDDTTSTFTATSGAQAPDAVQVTANDDVPFYFARVIGASSGHVNRTAIASITSGACTSSCPGSRAFGELGSIFAGFQYYADPGMTAQYNLAAELRAKVLNSEIFTQFGMSVGGTISGPPVGINLDALSYKGIANGSLLLGDLAAAAGFGSVNELLSATITARALLNAEVTALRASSNATDVAAGNKIATFAANASNTLTMKLGDLISVATGSTSSAANYKLNALDLLESSAELISGKNFFSTTITTGVPGVVTAPIRVAIIETPQIHDNFQGSGPCTEPLRLEAGCGPKTAQVRIATSIPITLDLTSSGIALVQATTIPIVIEAAAAESFFSTIKCGQPTSTSSTNFRVLTNGIAMHIGSVTDAALQSTTSLSLQAQALLHGSVSIGAPPVLVDLDATTAVTVKKTFKNGSVLSGDIESNSAVLGADETHTFVGDMKDNILPTSWRYAGGVGNTNISNTVFSSLGITNPALNAAISTALQTQLANFDTLFIDPVLSSLGVTIAGADGMIDKVACTLRLVK